MGARILGALSLAVLGAVIASLAVLSARLRPGGDDRAVIAAGAEIYRAHCAACHGVNLEGQPKWRERLQNGRLPAPPHDASGHTWHQPDAQLFGITKHGLAPFAPPGYQSDMPAFDGVLSDDQIAAVLAYIKSTWPPDIRERQARINAQAEQ